MKSSMHPKSSTKRVMRTQKDDMYSQLVKLVCHLMSTFLRAIIGIINDYLTTHLEEIHNLLLAILGDLLSKSDGIGALVMACGPIVV